MTKAIPNKVIVSVLGKPAKTPRLNDDGAVAFKADENGRPVLSKDGEQQPELVEAKTGDLMRIALLNVPRAIVAPNDAMRIPRLFHHIEVSTDKETIELPDKLYEWLHRLLNRKVPIDRTKYPKDSFPSMHEVTYAYEIWGGNSALFVNQLKIEDEREDFGKEDVATSD